MEILEKRPKYSERTGEQEGHFLDVGEHRCDFSGKKLFDGGHESIPHATYSLDYGNSDPCWGCGDGERQLRSEYDINVFQFLQRPFEFRWDCQDFAVKWGFLWEGPFVGFDQYIRQCKARTALHLLEEGIIEPWQLNGGPLPEGVDGGLL